MWSQIYDIESKTDISTVFSRGRMSEPPKNAKSGGLPLLGLLYTLIKFPIVAKEFYRRLPDKVKELPMKLMNRARERDPIVKWMRVD